MSFMFMIWNGSSMDVWENCVVLSLSENNYMKNTTRLRLIELYFNFNQGNFISILDLLPSNLLCKSSTAWCRIEWVLSFISASFSLICNTNKVMFNLNCCFVGINSVTLIECAAMLFCHLCCANRIICGKTVLILGVF